MLMVGQAHTSEVALSMVYERVQAISIDHAVMEGAATDRRVVMGAMSVGWSDLGGWTAILGGLGVHGDGVVVQPGTVVVLRAPTTWWSSGTTVGSSRASAPDGAMSPQRWSRSCGERVAAATRSRHCSTGVPLRESR